MFLYSDARDRFVRDRKSDVSDEEGEKEGEEEEGEEDGAGKEGKRSAGV